MKIKITVLISTIIIFFIRIFWKESTNIFNDNLDLLFGIRIDKLVIYIYQLLIMLLVTSVKSINNTILYILLLINIFIICSYCIHF